LRSIPASAEAARSGRPGGPYIGEELIADLDQGALVLYGDVSLRTASELMPFHLVRVSTVTGHLIRSEERRVSAWMNRYGRSYVRARTSPEDALYEETLSAALGNHQVSAAMIPPSWNPEDTRLTNGSVRLSAGFSFLRSTKREYSSIIRDISMYVLYEGYYPNPQPYRYLEVGIGDCGTLNLMAPSFAISDAVDVNSAALANIRYSEGNSIRAHHMSSDEFAESVLVDPSMYFDVVFIDGDHSFDQVVRDFESVVPKVRPGGLVFLHNTYPPTIDHTHCLSACGDAQRITSLLRSRYVHSFEVITLPPHCGLTIARKIDRSYPQSPIHSATRE